METEVDISQYVESRFEGLINRYFTVACSYSTHGLVCKADFKNIRFPIKKTEVTTIIPHAHMNNHAYVQALVTRMIDSLLSRILKV